MNSRMHLSNFGSQVLLFVLLSTTATESLFGQGDQEGRSDAAPAPITVELSLAPTILDMAHLKASKMGFMPKQFLVVDTKPAGITKVPARMRQPKYGAFRIGNGPRSVTYFVVDEPPKKNGKFYVDLNQNGDLTDDGDGKWDETKVVDGVNTYFATVPVHASWGTPLEETSSGSYSLYIYKRHGGISGGYAKVSGRTGKLGIGEKSYSIVVGENSNDGIFTIPVKGDLTRRFVQLHVDLDGDGTFKGVVTKEGGKELKATERFDLSEPFKIEDQWYIGRTTINGDKLTLTPTDPPGSAVALSQAPVEMKRLLAAGTPVPDFTAQTPEGESITFRAFEGKVTIIDFWATSCAPCLSAMPGLERIYQATKDQGVEVLSFNVFDEKEQFDAWIGRNRGTKYNFTFAFDPAESGSEESIASEKFHVPVLPTIYVVSREGKIVDSLLGGGKEDKLIEILAGQGIKVEME